jgi:hypothetical protein
MKQANANRESEGMIVTDYKRMVSYMYQYENGVKKKNIGFARVEAKDGQCKITLHMQLIGQLDSIFPTYLIQRNTEDIELIYVGDTVLKNQVMDSKLVMDVANVMGSGHHLSEMGGLLLFLNDSVFYATEWDDKPIMANEVLEALRPKHKREPVLTLEEELLVPKYKLPRGYKTIERLLGSGSGLRSRVTGNGGPGRDVEAMNHDPGKREKREELQGPEISRYSYSDMAVTVEIEENRTEIRGEEKGRQGDAVSRELEAGETSELDRDEWSRTEENWTEENPAEAQTESGMSGKENRMEGAAQETEGAKEEADPMAVVKIFEKHPRIYPFEDNEILICAKIEPKDLGLLPKELWALSNNSFLVHGYYCYHHLIFAKMKDRYGCRYILGIPGIYHNREKFMARMFGFDCFKPIRRRELRQGDFGYWYMTVGF